MNLILMQDFFKHPVSTGVLLPLVVVMILYIIKETAKIVRTVNSIHESQETFRENQAIFRDSIKEIMSKQEENVNDIKILTKELRDHMTGEEYVVTDILAAIARVENQLDEKSLAMARAAFRQGAVHSNDAFYDFGVVNGSWEFMWGNTAYFELSGLSLAEAKADMFWEVNVPLEDRERLRKTMLDQASRGEIIEVEYNRIIPGKGLVPVKLSAVPILDKDDTPIAYFCAIKVLAHRRHDD